MTSAGHRNKVSDSQTRVLKMKRFRITVQIQESARQKIDKLVYEHEAESLSDFVRLAIEQYLKNYDYRSWQR